MFIVMDETIEIFLDSNRWSISQTPDPELATWVRSITAMSRGRPILVRLQSRPDLLFRLSVFGDVEQFVLK